MLVLHKPQQRNLDVWIYLLAISFLCSVAKERFQTQLFKAWVLTQPYFENSKKKSISYWKGPFSDYFKRANVQHFSLYVEKVWNSCFTHFFFFENMIKLKIQKLEEEFNCRIEMLAVQMALLWPCFLFQQVPLARIFFGHCYHSTVVTSRMYVENIAWIHYFTFSWAVFLLGPLAFHPISCQVFVAFEPFWQRQAWNLAFQNLEILNSDIIEWYWYEL